MDAIMERKESDMVEVVPRDFATYRQYKEELDRELARAAQSFVRIGYLLRLAEDTDILRESGYRNLTEFAAAEYGLDKSQVSRFININIEFSEGGYSDHLQARYEKFGYAKLAIMLSMPEAVNEELPSSLSKADIQAVAEEVKAEAKISDIEIAIEKAEVAPVQPEGQEATLLYQAAARLCREQQDLFRKLWMEQESSKNMQEVLAPLGENVFMVRPPGMGRLMIAVRDQDTSITAVRKGDKERCSTEEFVAVIRDICRKGSTPEEAFLREFGEEMEKPAAASSGQDPQPAAAVEKKEPKQRKVSKVTKARMPEAAAVMEEPPASAIKEPEEQLPGQMEVYDYPEMIPEGMKEESNGTGETEAGGSPSATDEKVESVAGTDGGGQEPGDVPEPDAVPGTTEDGRCTGDTEQEDDLWMKARRAEEKLRQYLTVWDGQDIPGDLLHSAYRTAIDLAAAIEGILIRRGKNE